MGTKGERKSGRIYYVRVLSLGRGFAVYNLPSREMVSLAPLFPAPCFTAQAETTSYAGHTEPLPRTRETRESP